MGNRVDVNIASTISAYTDGAGTCYLVKTPAGVLYCVHMDQANDISFRKSTDGGFSWSVATVIFAGTATNLAVWYDRWSGINADLIHCAYTESGGSDTLYRTIDAASSDALSTQTTIFAGTSRANGGCLSIARARGGNVYCATMIDAGAEGGFFRLPNANVPNGAWDAARTTCFEAATQDQVVLMPGYNADSQDMHVIFVDASANAISVKRYDDSANTQTETAIAAMTDVVANGGTFPHMACAPDLSNNRTVLIFWNAVDTANADLQCYTIEDASVTAKTDVVTNSTDDQGAAALGIDTATGYWYAAYCGKSDGSETFPTDVKTYLKVSQDAGTSWGPESLLTGDGTPVMDLDGIWVSPRFTGGYAGLQVLRGNGGVTQSLLVNTLRLTPGPVGSIGI